MLASEGVVTMRQLVAMRLTVAVAVVVGASVLAIPRAAAADEPTVRWERSAGVELEAVATAEDGDAVVTGSAHRGDERHPAMIVRRYDRSGDIVWTRWWHPQGTRVDGLDVAIGPDGGIYVVGTVARANLEGGGFFIRKYGPSGAFLWKDISDGGYGRGVGVPEIATGVAVSGTNVAVVGHEYGCCGEMIDDGWVRLYRSDGLQRWTRDFEVPGVANRTNDTPLAVEADATGMYVGGRVEMTPRTLDSVVVDSEAVVQKLRYDGTRAWSWLLEDVAVKDNDTVTALAIRDGAVFAAGYGNGVRWPRSEGMLARFTRNGDVRWMRTWGEPIDRIRPADVSTSPSGLVLVTGSRRHDGRFSSTLFLRTFAPDGTARARTVLQALEDTAGTGVDAAPGGAYVSGWVEVSADVHGGRLYRYVV